MTWREFKEAVEARGGEHFTDDSLIDCIDVSDAIDIGVYSIPDSQNQRRWRIWS